jgi:hypothetical protein
MKTIVKNKDNWIIKNNKDHVLYYSKFYSFQEDIGHNKKDCFDFQGKQHYYYKKKESFDFESKAHYYFNDFIIHENNN